MIKDLNEITYSENHDHVPVIRFRPFDGIEWLNCGFSTRMGGVSSGCHESLNLGFERGDICDNVIENFNRFAASAGFETGRMCLPSQWHTNNTRISGSKSIIGDIRKYGEEKKKAGIPDPDQRIKNAVDGQITDEKGVVLITYGADCTPVYIIDTAHRAIGLVHSGWKGTLNSISSDAIKLMNARYGTKAEDIIAVIGPSISSDNYEVGFDVAENFIKKHNIDVNEHSEIVRSGLREGKYQLDLWEANRRNLTDCGVRQENIHISGLCTFREKELFYSHRRDGNARGVMAAFACIT